MVRGVPAPSSMPFFARLWFAYVVFFRVLFNGEYAAELHSPKALPPPEKAKALPEPEPNKPEPKKEPEKKVEPPKPPSTDAALQLLALFQREGRFVDFLEEDVSSFPDADIGAAARVVHSGCRKALRDHVKLEAVRTEEEGVKVTIPDPVDAAAVKLTGNVQGKGPYTGTLRHKGWRAAEITLPEAVAGHDARILAQAEVEL
jgi:hypothetical protein